MNVRKKHYWDGTLIAGKPYGPVLKVTHSYPHKPIDGPSFGIICHLSDGSWQFLHNLQIVRFTKIVGFGTFSHFAKRQNQLSSIP